MTNGEHVYVAIIPFRNGLYDINWKCNNTDDEAARSAFRSVLIIEPDVSVYGEANGTYALGFADLMIDLSRRVYNYTYQPGEYVSPHVISTYASVVIFAQVMNEIYSNPAIAVSGSGRSLVKHFLNRTFQTSITNATINEFGERMPIWVVNQFDTNTGELRTVMQFDPDNPNTTMVTPIQWPREWPPDDEPDCGFRGDRSHCVSIGSPALTAVANAAAILIICVAVAVSLCIWRRMRTNQRKSKWWILDCRHLNWDGIYVSGQVNHPGKSGTYGEYMVWITPVSARLRHLSIPNINRFFGVCYTNEKEMVFVSAYCSRGSLCDLVQRLRLDKDFQFSLIQDLLQGLTAVHQSPLRAHGSLSSHNCLIDNRFTLNLGSLAYPRLRSALINLDCVLTRSTEMPVGFHQAEPLGDPRSDIHAVGLIMAHIILQKEVTYASLLEVLENPFERVDPVDIMMPIIGECLRTSAAEPPDIHAVAKMFRRATGYYGNENLMERIARRLERYTTELDALVTVRNLALIEEKKKCDALLLQMLPKDIVAELRKGSSVNPETFDSVTVMFSDIGRFSEFVLVHSPSDIMTFLNEVYSVFDLVLPRFDAYKVETIKDSYMVVSGLPKRNGSAHAQELGLLAQTLIHSYSKFTKTSETALRVGLHSGSCVAGIVGNKTPRYCLFGDTVNTASRMLLYSQDDHIHLSCATVDLLTSAAEFVLVERGFVDVKGKGNVRTFWLQYDPKFGLESQLNC
ncbi:atrial natriuretic peptide receptor 1-like [Paramacrobiotus metropolitanus]|uniref:atrial natriuretic peptide receptor 1-like n=1 Tax=Paramacrobiotus metropolitanus TaxID=2943436 RepID=UPI0024456D7D|nr:atrial natriuretic peptide receptor 1-like [Paramacrobiotus metropolitanus]